MSVANTQANKKFYISTTDQNEDLDDHATLGFPGLTYVQVKGVGNYGESGKNTNIVTYDTLDDTVTQKGVGLTNAGDPPIECRRIYDDPGQIAMRAAAEDARTTGNNYAFKTEFQDGTVKYDRGLVMGPTRPGGRNEDFELEVFTLALNQVEVVVDPTP